MVATGSALGGWATLALCGGAGPGPLCLSIALLPRGGAPPMPVGVWVALGTPRCGWVGAGPGVGLVSLGPPMCPQVFFFLFKGVEACGVVGQCFSPVGGSLGGPG